MFPLIMMEYLLLMFALYLYQQTGGREGGRRENKYNKYSLEPRQAGGVLAPACGQAVRRVEVTSSLL